MFSDLERIQLELSRLHSDYDTDVNRLSHFERSAKDDLLRLWDDVNELQEVVNVTARHVEEIYDKDILKLQDFQGRTESVLVR